MWDTSIWERGSAGESHVLSHSQHRIPAFLSFLKWVHGGVGARDDEPPEIIYDDFPIIQIYEQAQE